MILQYKVPGAEELTQMKFTASEDFSSNKKLSASWLAAMHKVSKAGKTYSRLKKVVAAGHAVCGAFVLFCCYFS